MPEAVCPDCGRGRGPFGWRTGRCFACHREKNPCRHCGESRGPRGGVKKLDVNLGLCRHCWHNPFVRARGYGPASYKLPPEPEPTRAEPGTGAKKAVLAERAASRSQLFCDKDELLRRGEARSGGKKKRKARPGPTPVPTSDLAAHYRWNRPPGIEHDRKLPGGGKQWRFRPWQGQRRASVSYHRRLDQACEAARAWYQEHLGAFWAEELAAGTRVGRKDKATRKPRRTGASAPKRKKNKAGGLFDGGD